MAALFTLVFGLVLGPEAPLIVLGTAVGAVVARKAEPKQRQAAMLLGGVAAIGAIFGNPFVTAFMILEFAAMGLVPAVILPAVLVALGAGYLTQVGIWNLPGFGVHSLSVPGLPAYDSISPGDLLLGLVLAVVIAIVTVSVRMGAVRWDRFAGGRPVVALYATAVITALVLLVAEVGFDVGPTLILFSGQAGMAQLVGETSAVAVLVILVGKAIAYAAALGGGFRGGPIFPATFLGVAAAVLMSLDRAERLRDRHGGCRHRGVGRRHAEAAGDLGPAGCAAGGRWRRGRGSLRDLRGHPRTDRAHGRRPSIRRCGAGNHSGRRSAVPSSG